MTNQRLKDSSLKTTLNIGLENNPDFREYAVTNSISNIVGKLWHIGDVSACRLVTGQWDGKPERTLVVEFSSVRGDWLCLETNIEDLCEVLSQECIAYISEHTDTEGLIYSVDAQEAGRDELEFDYDFFETV